MSVADFIRSEVNSNEIVLFMKGTQAAPACGFSAQVVRILDHLGVTFKHLLLPIWLATYRYRDQLYQILVNARTGEVQGRRPYSVWKIFFLVPSFMPAGMST